MVYSNKFVMCVLRHGVPMKELANGVVQVPFDSEYDLRFRNKHNRRALVKIWIDGENVSGGGYIIEANSHIDIKRHHDKDSRFKFVSLDSADAVDFGKNGPNDDKVKGTIEARFYLEKERPPLWTYTPPIVHHHHHYRERRVTTTQWPELRNPYVGPSYAKGSSAGDPTAGLSHTICGGSHFGTAEYSARNAELLNSAPVEPAVMNFADPASSLESTKAALSAPVLQDGCTVEGSRSGQTFYSTYFDAETDYVAVKLFLQGFDPATTPTPVQTVRASKNQKITDLERENEELRRRLAEIENERLKRLLAEAGG